MTTLAFRRTASHAVLFGLVMSCTSTPPRSAGSDTTKTAAATASADSLRATADRSRLAGDSAAPMWLIIASDFQCPYCARWHHASHDSIRRAYVDSGLVRVAYLNFPLEQHRHARVAATAALCAGAQGKFWPVHDAIFETQERWSPLEDAQPVFDSLAAVSGADVNLWRGCMTEGVMDALVRADRERAVSAGVQSTPTFLLLPGGRPGQMIRGAVPLPELRHVLDSLLGRSGGS